MTSIWTPNGEFLTNRHPDIENLNRHVKMYDDGLSVGVHEQSGDICVFKDSEMHGKVAICGWQRIPTIDECIKKLYEIDTFRHGDTILTDAWAKDKEIRDAAQAEVDEVASDLKERIEFELRPR